MYLSMIYTYFMAVRMEMCPVRLQTFTTTLSSELALMLLQRPMLQLQHPAPPA